MKRGIMFKTQTFDVLALILAACSGTAAAGTVPASTAAPLAEAKTILIGGIHPLTGTQPETYLRLDRRNHSNRRLQSSAKPDLYLGF
jgi:hypothetical protein